MNDAPATPGASGGELPDYLAPDFAPAKATIMQLVRILTKHDVELPATRQRKEEYVRLFESAIAANRDVLLRARARPTPKPPKNSVFAVPSNPPAVPTPLRPSSASNVPAPSSASSSAPFSVSGAGGSGVEAAADTKKRIRATPARQAPGGFVAPDAADNPFLVPSVHSGGPSSTDADLDTDEHAAATAGTPRKRVAAKTPRRSASLAAVSGSARPAETDDDQVFSDENPFQAASPTRVPVTLASAASSSTPLKSVRSKSAAKAKGSVAFDRSALLQPATPEFGDPNDATVDLSFADTAHGSPSAFSPAGSSRTLTEIMNSMDAAREQSAVPVPERRVASASVRRRPAAKSASSSASDHETASASARKPAVVTLDRAATLTTAPVQAPGSPLPARLQSRASQRASAAPRRKLVRTSNGIITASSTIQRDLSLALTTLGLAATALFVHWLVFLHPYLTYCANGSASLDGQDAKSVHDPYSPHASIHAKWNPLAYVLPTCISCPDYAVCSARNVTACTDEHILKPSLLAPVFGYGPDAFFPLAQPLCAPDTERLEKEARRQQRVTGLISVLDDMVRNWIGQAQCGEVQTGPELYWAWSSASNGQRRLIGMPLSLARSQLRAAVPKKWSDATFDELWSAVFSVVATNHEGAGYGAWKASQHGSVAPSGDRGGDMSQRQVPAVPLYTVLDESTRQNRLLVSIHPPVMSVSCRVRRAAWRFTVDYAPHLALSCAAIIAAVIAYTLRLQAEQERRIVSIIVGDVLDMVHAESDSHHTDPVRHPAPGLSIANLHDHLMPSSVSSGNAASTEADGTDEGTGTPYQTFADAGGHTVWVIGDTATRKRVWAAVCKEMGKTSTVRKTTMEVRGQPQDLWMWVASHALSPRKPKGVSAASAAASATPGRSVSGLGSGDVPKRPVFTESGPSTGVPHGIFAFDESVQAKGDSGSNTDRSKASIF